MPAASCKYIQTKKAPADLETKQFECEVKSLDDSGRFRIYFSVFGNVDRAKEVVDRGAYKNLDDYIRSGWIGTNHQLEKLPVAYPISAVQDEYGLLVEGQFHSHPEAQACRTVVMERMKAGKSVPGSVGYKVTADRPDTVKGESVRRLTSMNLYECSFVNLPANPQAELVSAKSAAAIPEPEGKSMPELITIDEAKALLDGVKAGRVISKANHEKLTNYAETLDDHGKKACAMASEMKSWLGQMKPNEEEKDIIPEDRAAGNSIPADQNPHGAVTADDLARRKAAKAEQLESLRKRVLKDYTRFASLSS